MRRDEEEPVRAAELLGTREGHPSWERGKGPLPREREEGEHPRVFLPVNPAPLDELLPPHLPLLPAPSSWSKESLGGESVEGGWRRVGEAEVAMTVEDSRKEVEWHSYRLGEQMKKVSHHGLLGLLLPLTSFTLRPETYSTLCVARASSVTET